MAVRSDHIFSWATFIDGAPQDKMYHNPDGSPMVNKGVNGMAFHDIVGFLDRGRIGRVFDTSRTPDGRYTSNAAMSVAIALGDDGALYQYYPMWACVWCSGNRTANTTTFALELERPRGKPLSPTLPATPAQVKSLHRLVEDLEEYTGQSLTRGDPSRGLAAYGTRAQRWPADRRLWEHNEVVMWDLQTSGATSCPSKRYDEFFRQWAEKGDDVTREEYEALVKRMENLELATFAGGEERSGDALLPRDERLKRAAHRIESRSKEGTEQLSRSALDWAVSAAISLAAHQNTPHGNGGITPHRHEMNVAIATTGPVVGDRGEGK
jgi:hypothetical protein